MLAMCTCLGWDPGLPELLAPFNSLLEPWAAAAGLGGWKLGFCFRNSVFRWEGSTGPQEVILSLGVACGFAEV